MVCRTCNAINHSLAGYRVARKPLIVVKESIDPINRMPITGTNVKSTSALDVTRCFPYTKRGIILGILIPGWC